MPCGSQRRTALWTGRSHWTMRTAGSATMISGGAEPPCLHGKLRCPLTPAMRCREHPPLNEAACLQHSTERSRTMRISLTRFGLMAGLAAMIVTGPPALAQEHKPNILFIMGDDIGWMQPSIYHRGL